MSSVEVEFEKKIGLEKDRVREIILFNDDINTFDYVIKTLMSICNHSLKQAEQCTFIVHYSGKCAVKSGSLNELKPICSKLLDAGLTAEIV